MSDNAPPPGDNAGAPSAGSEGLYERLHARRWLASGVVAVFVGLALAGFLEWLTALVALVAVIVLFVIVPRAPVTSRALRIDLRQGVLPTVDPGIVSFVDALPDPCYLLDRRGTVMAANASAKALFSVQIGEPLTARLRVPDLLVAFERVSLGGEPERVEFFERVPTERWFAGWFAGIGRRDDRRRPELVILIVDDLTERHRADQVRVDFVANASHELRTPLASLAGFIETLQGPARTDPEARDRFLSIMHDQATRMSRLIDDLLSLSRIEMKSHLRPSEPVDIVEVVRHVADALDPLARELGVEIEVDLPEQAILVPGDHDELVQVFDNLVENACRYGQTGGRVEIGVNPPEAPGGACSATVQDYGPGIAPEHQPRLTERFYRVDAEVSRQHRGTGLGLAIVKHIANRHRARLGIDSTPGEGALFTVEFPATIPPATVNAIRKSQ